MKSMLIAGVLSTFLAAGVQAQSEPVKTSKTGICHAPLQPITTKPRISHHTQP